MVRGFTGPGLLINSLHLGVELDVAMSTHGIRAYWRFGEMAPVKKGKILEGFNFPALWSAHQCAEDIGLKNIIF